MEMFSCLLHGEHRASYIAGSQWRKWDPVRLIVQERIAMHSEDDKKKLNHRLCDSLVDQTSIYTDQLVP